MPRSTLTLEIVQPGEKAADVVHAVITALGIAAAEGRDDAFVRLTSPMAYPVALTKAKRALFMTDPNGEYVRVLEGQ